MNHTITKTEKDYLLNSINNLILKYGEESCIKININTTIKRNGSFIEYRLNKDKNQYESKITMYLQEEFKFLISIVLINCIKNNTTVFKNMINDEIFMFTLSDWKEMINEYSI